MNISIPALEDPCNFDEKRLAPCGQMKRYMKKPSMSAFIDHLQTDGFVAYEVGNHKETLRYEGRDGYRKVALISGIGEIRYGRDVYKINGSVLLVTKPRISCTGVFRM